MVAKQPCDRYPSMTEVIRDLEQCLSEASPVVGSSLSSINSSRTEVLPSTAESETMILSASDCRTDSRTGQSLTLKQVGTPSLQKNRAVVLGSIATAAVVLSVIVFAVSRKPGTERDLVRRGSPDPAASSDHSSPANGETDTEGDLRSKSSAGSGDPRTAIATPFVTLRNGTEAARHATLEEALDAIQSHDVIEVHGNGPFPIGGPEAISVGVRTDNVFTLKGASGFRPLFVSAPGAELFNIHCDTARFENIDFVLAGPGEFKFYGVRDVSFLRCRCVSTSSSEGWLMSFHCGEEQIVRFSDCFVASARRDGVMGFARLPAKIEMSNTILMTRGNPLTLLAFGSTVRLNRCTVIGSSAIVWATPTNEKERSVPGTAELSRCLVFGVPYIGDHVRWQGKDNVYGISEFGASGVSLPGDVNLSFDEWVKSPAKPETGSKLVSTKAKRFDEFLDQNPAVMFGKLKTYLEDLRTLHHDVGADPAVADEQPLQRTTVTEIGSPWTDWLGPKLLAGGFRGDDWSREGDAVTTDRTVVGTEVLPANTHDGALRVTYLLRDSKGIQLSAREHKTGETRDFSYFAEDNGEKIQIARVTDSEFKVLAKQTLPPDISKAAPRTLELSIVGDTLTLTLNGTVVVTAKDSARPDGLFALAALKGVLIQKVEIQTLDR